MGPRHVHVPLLSTSWLGSSLPPLSSPSKRTAESFPPPPSPNRVAAAFLLVVSVAVFVAPPVADSVAVLVDGAFVVTAVDAAPHCPLLRLLLLLWPVFSGGGAGLLSTFVSSLPFPFTLCR